MAHLASSSLAFERSACRAGPSGRSHIAAAAPVTRFGVALRPVGLPAVQRHRVHALGGPGDVPPPPPPPPRPPQQQQQYSDGRARATRSLEDLSFPEIKERFLRPYYLQATFVLGALTLGLRAGAQNFVFADDPVSYLGTAVVTGLMCTAVAWVLFDFTDTPGGGNNFNSPK